MKEVFILYGKETKGLPEWLLEKYINEKTIRIPMLPTLRSLNLSNSVAIITYEILRQHNFEDLQEVSNYFDKELQIVVRIKLYVLEKIIHYNFILIFYANL